MKIIKENILSLIQTLKIFFTLFLVLSINSVNSATTDLKSLKSEDKSILQQKVLAMNLQLKNNPMEKFDYKFLTLTKLEAVFYETKIPKLPTEEDKSCAKNYLFTQLYYQIQLPCMDKTVVCTYGELLKEYQAEYPEIDWSLPKKIETAIGLERAQKSCLVLTSDSFDKVADNIFICHLQLDILAEIQAKISEQVREVYQKNTELFMEYLPNMDIRGRVSGLLRLDQESLKFIGLDNKKIIVEIPYLKIQPFPHTYYKREKFPIDDDEKKYDQRCIKIEMLKNPTDSKTFCIFYSAGDFTKKNQLVSFRARWLSEFYTSKIVKRIRPAQQQQALEKLAEIKDSLEVNSGLLTSVMFDFREKFIAKYAKLSQEFKNKKDNNAVDLAKALVKVKEDEVKKACNDIPICIRALHYSIVKGMLPLGTKGTKFSMDMNNPYLSLYPNRNIKVDNLNDGLGQTLVQQVSRLKGAENYFAEEVTLPPGGVPDYKAILNALQTFKIQRKFGISVKSLSSFKNCNASTGLGYQLNRKMALLPLMVEKDFLFDFLGTVRQSIDGQ